MGLRRVRDHNVFKWLYPGMHVKRWLMLMLFGVSLMGLGLLLSVRMRQFQ
jgi:hypothetical protein